MALGIYANRGLQGYIANANFTVTPPQTTNWTITVGNMMILAQFDGSRWMAVLLSADGDPQRLGRGFERSPDEAVPIR